MATTQRPPLFVAEPCSGTDGHPLIQKVFIANRGEIACRVIATCRKLNLTSIAVYLEEDKSSRHVRDADEAICLGSITADKNPFLDIELLVSAARHAGADAVHPGYGYLSENPDFADKVREAGLIFIGPSSLAMMTLGNKRSSKVYLQEHAPEVPLIPGFSGASQNVEDLKLAAESIGFPVMLKASSGGGGKGMRIVRDASLLGDELQRVQSEASRSFGSADAILEKYIEAGKHVEFQIVGDRHGRVISLWDRDCSLQRRHQKIVEETPCPWLSQSMREAMSQTAIRIAELIGYEGAGTVEFVVDVKEEKYYFLEVNARLQVEHPITEEVTGIDLVALQVYVASGGRLDDLDVLHRISQKGHAIECRLCAEDPHHDFFPEHGVVRLWQPAPGILGPGRDIRYETAIETGSQVSIHFDSMIAKIVVWAPTRARAIAKTLAVLANTACVGVRTNQLFLQSCLRHPGFRSDPAYTTSFIARHIESLLTNPYTGNAGQTTFASLESIPSLVLRAMRARQASSKGHYAFRNIANGFRNQRYDLINRPSNFVVTVHNGVDPANAKKNASLRVWEPTEDPQTFTTYTVSMPAVDSVEENSKEATSGVTTRYNQISNAMRTCQWTNSVAERVTIETIEPLPESHHGHWSSVLAIASVNNVKKVVVLCAEYGRNDSASSQRGAPQVVYAHVPALGTWARYDIYSALSFVESTREDYQAAATAAADSRLVRAPMPCKVLRRLKEEGAQVQKGEHVMVVESMKMEVSIVVQGEGKLKINFDIGDSVDEGVVLCEIL
ncbi:hypothetical protein PFICI_11096 [Pestalotiopsis fici W106-1]|uniref:Methylcrotonoyl-CoA carboxylase subunit alpha n=1 Tax=Pestalotiopsis fici (strain W106-1 / CGMCC3.15140) TaxID=1229662 RepID=W3WVU3_PESFW|nr:uncharacterized protein PFICI_11096 [Pestalotiopsis fici W106-1]ETS77222.1 hypothetical protein PFICI_11096 [Pestalotiopsis fici W106-1]